MSAASICLAAGSETIRKTLCCGSGIGRRGRMGRSMCGGTRLAAAESRPGRPTERENWVAQARRCRRGRSATMAGRRTPHRRRSLIGVLALMLMLLGLAPGAAMAGSSTGTYSNPLPIQIPGGGRVESCADPSIIRAQDGYWYMYCTTDPLRGDDRDAEGHLIFHLIPIHRSLDLVHWTYVRDVFSMRPAWVAPDAGLWAPDIHVFDGTYYLYYTASDTSLPGGGSAIGVATSSSPTGPWVDSGTPAVEPHPAPCCPDSRRWTFDPAVITDDSGQKYIYYGSYFGGISARKLSADRLHSDPASQVQITIANRYEGAYVVK